MTQLAFGLRHSAFGICVRRLLRVRGFTFVVVMTLGLGVAVNAAVFAIARAVTTRIEPTVDLSHLFVPRVTNLGTAGDRVGLPLAELHRIEPDLAAAGVAVAVSDPRELMTITAEGRAEVLGVEAVDGEYARVFDLRPLAGRWIRPDDNAGEGRTVAVISARIWQAWFARDPHLVERGTVSINGATFQVVGVAGTDFRGVQPALTPPEIWVPEASLKRIYPAERDPRWYASRWATVFFRPRTGATIGELRTRFQRALVGGIFDRDLSNIKPRVVPAAELNDPVRHGEWLVLGLALLVFVGACANVANLFAARASDMRQELAVRQSLGASRRHLVGTLLGEAVVLGVAASAFGSLAAAGAVRMFARAFPVFLVDRAHYSSLTIPFDPAVLAYSLAAAVGAACIVGLITGLRAAHDAPMSALAGVAGTPPRRRLHTSLVSVQVTVALVLVMLTGLVLENAPPELARDVRFDASALVSARADLRLYGFTVPDAVGFFDRLLQASRALPEAEDAALASAVPGGTGEDAPPTAWLLAATANNVGTRRITASALSVSPSFFETVGLRLQRGRVFTQADGDGAPLTAVLSRSAADVLFPGREAVGQPVTYGFRGPTLTIVGIVDDPVAGPSDHAPFERPSNVIFLPWAQQVPLNGIVLLRASASASVAEPLRAVVRDLDARVGLRGPTRVDASILAWTAPLRAARLLIVWGAAVALTIALLGVYGVLTYYVTRRTREFGIRMALGATRRQIVRLVFDHSVHVLLVGLLCGVLVATLGSRLLEHTLVQLMPNGITTWTLVPIAVLVAGTIAGCLPAWRAARVEPMTALRNL